MNELSHMALSSALRYTGWLVDGATFTALDESRGLCICEVVTTHLAKRGMPEERFVVLATIGQYITFPLSAKQALLEWCQAHKERE